MKCLVVLIKGGCKEVDARSFLEENSNSLILGCKNEKEVTDHLNELADEKICTTYSMADFMDLWNDTDDDRESIEIEEYFIGYVYIN